MGVRKALRAMVRPVREIARAIQDQDLAGLATYPGIGEATAERTEELADAERAAGALTAAQLEQEARRAEARADQIDPEEK